MALPLMAIPAIISGVGAIWSALKTSKERPNYPQFDPNALAAELAKIDSLFNAQATSLTDQATQRYGEMQTQSASDLAARGIYGSPVSANVDMVNRKTVENALASALGQLSGQQAATKASLVGDWAKVGFSSNLTQAQEDYNRRLSSGNILSSLLAAMSTSMFPSGNERTVPIPSEKG